MAAPDWLYEAGGRRGVPTLGPMVVLSAGRDHHDDSASQVPLLFELIRESRAFSAG